MQNRWLDSPCSEAGLCQLVPAVAKTTVINPPLGSHARGPKQTGILLGCDPMSTTTESTQETGVSNSPTLYTVLPTLIAGLFVHAASGETDSSPKFLVIIDQH